MRVVAATKNRGKIKELTSILSKLGIEVVSQGDYGINVDIVETGKTFKANALLKARAIALMCDDAVLADDSGLCVEALDGAPGIYSARYAGENATDTDRVHKLLTELEGVKNRRAKFVTAIAFIFPDGGEITVSGETHGSITEVPRGSSGFGYDPVFLSDDLNKTFGEATEEEKNSVSHRARAIQALAEELAKRMEV